MYVIKNKKTGKYWKGVYCGEGEPDFYTHDIQMAYVFYEKGLFNLETDDEVIEIEFMMREVKR